MRSSYEGASQAWSITEAAESIHRGLVSGGLDFAVYLPDSVLYGLEQLLEQDESIRTFVCSREDEGIAIATGASLAGNVAAVLMEGSGMGFAPLILTRAKLQRTPLLLIFSHVPAFGDGPDFYAAARIVGKAVCEALDIPCVTLDSEAPVERIVKEALVTVRGQKAIVALAVPGYMKA